MINYTDSLEKMFAQSGTWLAPAAKANQTAVTHFEKMVDLQMKTFEKYVGIGMDQLKAAAAIDSPKALQEYVSNQVEVANSVRQHVMEDTQALLQLGVDFV